MSSTFYILAVASVYTRDRIAGVELFMSCDQRRCAEADRDPQNIFDPQKDCGSFVDEKLRALHRRNLNK